MYATVTLTPTCGWQSSLMPMLRWNPHWNKCVQATL